MQRLAKKNQTPVDFKEVLSQIVWEFRGALTNFGTHQFHPYPARYIPQIPRELIRVFTQKGDTVYDPFVGCGTTCVEANSMERDSMGNDINPLAVLLAKVKTTPISDRELSGLEKLEEELACRAKIRTKKNLANIPVQSIDWFESFVVQEISHIKKYISLLKSENLRNFCNATLSSIIVSVSRQDSDTRYVRVAKSIVPDDATRRFITRLRRHVKIMKEFRDQISCGKTRVKIADSRLQNIFPENSASFAVTSPPYPNAYDYHLYHRHRLLWLDMDPLKLKSQEIGAHANYSKKNGQNEMDFLDDMSQVLVGCARILRAGCFFVIVVGNSIIHNRKIDNVEIIKQACTNTSFELKYQFDRKIHTNRKSFNPVHGNINKETLMILKNAK